MVRILFVDDEPKLLDGLKRMLRPQRNRWEMAFAIGGEEALKSLAAQPADVVVTDMRMPGMNGAQLLEKVQELYPNTIRIVLSGFFEVEAGLRAVPVAHQFLSKPCDPDRLQAAIEHSSSLSAVLPDGATRRIVSAIGTLPSMPKAYSVLLQEIENPESTLTSISRLIEEDVALTAKVLQLVNSAFFGTPQRASSVHAAVGYLGLDILKQVVLTVEISQMFEVSRGIPGFSFEGFQRHSTLAAHIAARLSRDQKNSTANVTGALLHDAGKLVLASRLPDRYAAVKRVASKSQRPVQDVEMEWWGTTHAEIGAYLLGLWGLPQEAVEAIGAHHRPTLPASDPEELDLRTVVYLSSHFASELSEEPCALIGLSEALPDNYVRAWRIEERLPEWRAMARELAEAPPSG